MRTRPRVAVAHSEQSNGVHPVPGRYAVVNDPVCRLRAARPLAASPGSVFSLDHFLENLLVHSQVSDCSLEPGIFCLQFFETLGLVDPHAAIFLAPAVKGLLGNTKIFDRLSNGFPWPLQNLSFPQIADNRIGGVSFLCRVPVLLSVAILT